jgi:1,4-dihydroxy-2-naphthoate octaprenyltransferase
MADQPVDEARDPLGGDPTLAAAGAAGAVAGDVSERPRPAPMAVPVQMRLAARQAARWARVIRPPLLICALAPVLVTAAEIWARGARLAIGTLVLTGVAVALVLAGASLLDAYLEHVRIEHLYDLDPASSTARAAGHQMSDLVGAGIPPIQALRAAVALLLVGASLGVPLALLGAGWPMLVLGLAGLAAAFFYSATTYALKRLPLGDLAVFLALGPGLVAFTTLAQRAAMTPERWLLGGALGLFAAATLEAGNLRALSPEIRDGRATLARLLGRGRARLLVAGCLAGAYIPLLAIALAPSGPHGALAALLAAPVAVIPLTGALRARGAPAMDLVVTQTLRAYAFFAAWLVLGLLLGALYPHVVAAVGPA